MPPNYKPTVYCVEQAMVELPRVVEIILLGDLNVRLREPHDAQEEELVTMVADCRLVDMTYQFLPRRR